MWPLAVWGVVSGGISACARGLGEVGATARIAGNIAGQARRLPAAVYSAVGGGDMAGAYKYVAILAGISLLVVIGMNWLTAKERRYGGREAKR